jgi:dolichol-phosphate mannosyltransferase
MPISVVIPAFNEEGNIGRLIKETVYTVPEDMLGEIIVVDDGSTDHTADEVRQHMNIGTALRLVRHAENAGQSASLRSGIEAARFPIIATMDGDGQNDPADIPALFKKLAIPGNDTGPALVGGIRAGRKDSGSKRIASKAANLIRDALLRDACPDTGCGIKLFQRDIFLRLPYFTSMHRYLPALFQLYGHRTEFIPVNDRPRMAGKSKYNNFNRALIGFFDLFGVMWLRRRTKNPTVTEE